MCLPGKLKDGAASIISYLFFDGLQFEGTTPSVKIVDKVINTRNMGSLNKFQVFVIKMIGCDDLLEYYSSMFC